MQNKAIKGYTIVKKHSIIRMNENLRKPFIFKEEKNERSITKNY